MFLEVTPVDYNQGPKRTIGLMQVIDITPDNQSSCIQLTGNRTLYVKEPYDKLIAVLGSQGLLAKIE